MTVWHKWKPDTEAVALSIQKAALHLTFWEGHPVNFQMQENSGTFPLPGKKTQAMRTGLHHPGPHFLHCFLSCHGVLIELYEDFFSIRFVSRLSQSIFCYFLDIERQEVCPGNVEQ